MRQQVRRRPFHAVQPDQLKPGTEVRHLDKRTIAVVLPDPNDRKRPAVQGSSVTVNVANRYLATHQESWPIHRLEVV